MESILSASPNRKWNNIVISMAGIFQAASLVEQLAKTGRVPSPPLETAIASLFDMNPDSVLSVYGNNTANLDRGLNSLVDAFGQRGQDKNPDTLRYVLSLLHLQKKLSQRQDMLGVIGKRLEQAGQQAEHFGQSHDNVIANLASIYSDTISTFRFRIQVTGDFTYLQQERIANQIRALLLAGIRSGVLWRQSGGSRLHLLTSRKAMARTAQEMLRNPPL